MVGDSVSGQVKDCLRLVARAWDAGEDVHTAAGVTVWRVRGGYNNALYRVDLDGAAYAVKLCVDDQRRRARREYGAMGLLQAAGLDLAPEPLGLDQSGTIVSFPAVVYRWLPGDPLPVSPAGEQLALLLEALQQLHGLRAGEGGGGLPTAWFHWFDFAPYLEELDDMLSRYGSWLAGADPQGAALADRLARLVDGCRVYLLSAGVEIDRDHVPLGLCRVDHNRTNAIWGVDGRLRWVDWEFSGWGDPALDLADMRWHVALDGIGVSGHTWMRAHYRRPAGDPTFEARLALWDRLLATRWPFLALRWLWSREHGPDRPRLTPLAVAPAEMWARFVRLLDRAEWFLNKEGTNA